jgi:hypothetical protein
MICVFSRFACRIIFSFGIAVLSLATAYADENPFIPRIILSSTIPANGDLNPYGLAFVPAGFASGGIIMPGDVLVSNFNNSTNCQATGTTIIKLTPNGTVAPAGTAFTFFSGNQIGLTLALGVLRRGFVIVGNVPSLGCPTTIVGNGTLQVVDRNGNLLGTPMTDLTFFDSPWGLTVFDLGDTAQIFVANVLSGNVSRLDVTVSATGIAIKNRTVVATGYAHRTDPSAVVVGPTGLAYNPFTDVLYVASTADNAIFAVPRAGHATFPVNKGTVVFADANVLRGPLALAFTPSGNLVTSNGDAVNPDPTHPSEVIEFTPFGQFVRQYNVDPAPGGAFGVATVLSPLAPFNFATVDDNTNALAVYGLDNE